MGRLSRSKAAAHGFGIFEDTTTSGPGRNVSSDAISAPSYDNFAVLQDRETNSDRSTPDFIDSLTAKLKELHIYSPKKNRADRSLLAPVRRDLPRLTIDTKIVRTLGHIREEAHHCTTKSTVTTSTQGPFPGELLQKTKQDEGIPSSAETSTPSTAPFRQTPDSFEASKPNFFSQVLRVADLEYHPFDIDSDIQASIARHKAATPLVTENVAQDTSRLSGETEDMAVAEPVVRLISPTPVGEEEAAMNKSAHPGVAVSVVEGGLAKESSLDCIEDPKDRVISISTDEGSVPIDEAPRTPSRSTSTSSRSRIEDSVEAIDRLEEELEAVNIAARLATPSRSGHIRSSTDDATNTAATAATSNTVLKRTASTLKRTQSVGAGAKPAPQTRTAQRMSVSMTDNDAAKASSGKTPTKKPIVTRPTSLLPPKPPAKSTKAPTKPSFELPGEAVARRIKEQREARLALQAEKATPPTPQRSRSLKVPTRPNFELPGEAISQRKRAEREARLKAQEEEERKRREFKARPIKAKLGSAAYPRETVTSRARQNKGSEANDSQVEERASKRASMLGTPRPLARTSSTRSPQTRGRGTSQTATEDQASRATSTSTGSMSGKRSTLSIEELEHQRLKGREIFQRDNCYIEDKERERREREWNAKMAREQAAERSRQASREWAEKQRRKQLAAMAAMAGQAA